MYPIDIKMKIKPKCPNPLKESKTFKLDWLRPPKEPTKMLINPIIKKIWLGPRNFKTTKKLVIFGTREIKAKPK